MKINLEQTRLLSKYLTDISKIIFASTIVGFFIPEETRRVSVFMFLIGAVATITSLLIGLKVAKQIKS